MDLKTDQILPETGAVGFNVDENKLKTARQKINAGDPESSIDLYQSLIESGEGLNVIIGDLEIAASKYQDQAKLRHLLGDAYMQNGQLQKAMDTYREALDLL